MAVATTKKIRGDSVYRFYQLGKDDHDPVLDRIDTILDDEGLNANKAAQLSGLAQTTIRNWILRKTRRPQVASVMNLLRSCGYDMQIVKVARTVQSNVIKFTPRVITRHGASTDLRVVAGGR